MEDVYIHHLTLHYQLMLDAKHGEIQFVNNAHLIGYLMQIMYVYLFMLNAKLIKDYFVQVVMLDMILLMDHVHIHNLILDLQLMGDVKHGMLMVKDVKNVHQDGLLMQMAFVLKSMIYVDNIHQMVYVLVAIEGMI